MIAVLVIAASLGMYLKHRNANETYTFGAIDAPDRVNVSVWINRVDTDTQTVSVSTRLMCSPPEIWPTKTAPSAPMQCWSCPCWGRIHCLSSTVNPGPISHRDSR
ncbi:hypothetical protein [Mycolicibacterium frederiksbergense]|uniref:hypothetical protein n=1 Tax=Mycolicibacterium frederiksbergense TaxID=117567 RepID=UPI002474F4D8|nr:hypothetical protein [Mycolicibacterium frederiksbergense]